MTQERFTRAQPHELKTIRLRKPLEEKNKKQIIIIDTWNQFVRKKIKEKKERSKVIALNALEIMSNSCKAKKARARHEYFSMRKSGKGAFRANQKSSRFTVRC